MGGVTVVTAAEIFTCDAMHQSFRGPKLGRFSKLATHANELRNQSPLVAWGMAMTWPVSSL